MSKICQFKETTNTGVWICEECKVLTPFGRFYKKAPIRPCPGIWVGPKQKAILATYPESKNLPGTILRDLISKLHITVSICEKCRNLERKMNDLKWQGCKKNFKSIVEELNGRFKSRIWFKKFWISIVVWFAIQIAWFKSRKESENMLSLEETQLLTDIKARLNGRTFQEAITYLERCKRCSNFRTTYCTKYHNIADKLAVGICKHWTNTFAKDSVAYRFITTQDLTEDTYKLVPAIPTDIDTIAGGARSGLIPATILSTHLHLPLLSVGKNTVVSAGSGWRIKDSSIEPKNILFVEDTVYGGATLTKNLRVLQNKYPKANILTAAVYVHPQAADKLDLYALSLPGRHYLEWNFFNSIAISRCVYDFDGILCEDIAGRDDDDGERYIEALKNAKPKYLVRREPIPIIATARLEKYRSVTEEWLQRYGIRYKKLIMGPWKNNKERAVKGAISRFKADIYRSYKYTLFVESDPAQAREIAHLTRKEVLCPILKRVIVDGSFE